MSSRKVQVSEKQDVAPPALGLWTLRFGLGVTILLLAVSLIKLVQANWLSISYPYELDYGEGIVWQQMINIAAGKGYAPLGVFPAIVYHYPPVYHLVVSATASLVGSDGLSTGRAISLLATLISILLVARLTFAAIPSSERLRVRALAAFLAAGCVATIPTIGTWAGYMRVDMLAAAFCLAGLWFTLGSPDNLGRLTAAALCFVLATYTKQTSIAAPAASFAILWLARPRAAWTLLVMCSCMGLAALAMLVFQTDGEFVRHVLLYNMNRVDPTRALLLPLVLLPGIVGLTLALLGVRSVWKRLRPGEFGAWRNKVTSSPSDFAASLMLGFLLLKTAMLPTIMKSGANDNYLIEWLFTVAVFIGVGVVPVLNTALEGARWPRPIFVAMVVVGLPIQAYRSIADGARDLPRTSVAERTQLVERIAREPKPVISDDMVLLIRAGRPVLWEPAIAAELGHGGLYDEAAFVNKVRRGDFGFFVTVGDRGDTLYDQRYNPAVAEAIDAAYPRRERHGRLVVHLPSEHPKRQPTPART
jgi:hypothetical protein